LPDNNHSAKAFNPFQVTTTYTIITLVRKSTTLTS